MKSNKKSKLSIFWTEYNLMDGDYWDREDPDGIGRGTLSLIAALVIGGFIFLITKH